MIKNFLTFVYWLSITCCAFSQGSDFCGTPSSVDSNVVQAFPWFGNESYLSAFLDSTGYFGSLEQNKSTGVIGGVAYGQYQIPVKAWITSNSGGWGGLPIDDLNDYIDFLNATFQSAGTQIHFYLKCDIGYIYNYRFHSIQSEQDWIDMLSSYRDWGAFNIFFVDSGNGWEGRGTFPWYSQNFALGLATGGDYFAWRANVLVHEVGHVLGLFHTHHPGRTNNSDYNHECSNCYQEAVSRTRLQGVGCGQTTGSSKCSVNGDFLCDTQADPGLRDDLGQLCAEFPNCTYNLCNGVTDNWGDAWVPPSNNYMSYADPNCMSTFTQDQIGVMHYSILATMNHRLAFMFGGADVFEPDNRQVTARVMTFNDKYHHTFHQQPMADWTYSNPSRLEACDEDWMTFSLNAPGRPIRIFTEAVPGMAQPNTLIRLFDAAGTLIAENDNRSLNDDFSELRLNLGTGTYAVQVVDLKPFGGQFPRHYYLNLEECTQCCENSALAAHPLLDPSTGDFNFGAITATYYQSLAHSVQVDRVKLQFNQNQPQDFVNQNGALPLLGSELLVSICNNAVVDIQDLGVMDLGYRWNQRATVTVESGSELILRSGGTLVIKERSRLVIAPGAKLTVEPNARIILQDQDAVLEMNGQLVLAPNAVFAFSGLGRVEWGAPYWGNQIVAGVNSEILLQGSSGSHTFLVLKDNASLNPPSTLGVLQLRNGRVSMGQSALINSADAAITLRNLKIEASNPLNRHNGVQLNGQASHTVEDVEISGATTGVTAYQMWNQGATLRLNRCDFHDNLTGLQVHTRGAVLTQCDFSHNETGWKQEMGSTLSRATSCSFNDNEWGIHFLSAGGDLYFRESEARQNTYGVVFSGPGTLYGKCGQVANNTTVGFSVGMGALLDLSDYLDPAGSQVDFSGNDISIGALFPRFINLRYGQNDLVPQVENGGNVVQGYVLTACTGNENWKAEKNHWNSRGGNAMGDFPLAGLDYVLAPYYLNPNLTACSHLVSFSDQQRALPFSACSYGNGGGGGGSTIRNCGNCSNLMTDSFANVPIDSAMRKALSKLELVNSGGDDLEALLLFTEIVEAEIPDASSEDLELQSSAMVLARTAYNSACADGDLNLMVAYEDLLQDPSYQALRKVISSLPDETFSEAFLSELDKAMNDYSSNLLDSTLVQMDGLLAQSVAGFEDWMVYVDCYIEAQVAVMDGELSREEFGGAVAGCASSKWEGRPYLGFNDLDAYAQSRLGRPELLVSPNPAEGVLHVELRHVSSSPILRLYDLHGRSIPIAPVVRTGSEAYTALDLAVDRVPAGVYLLQVTVGREVLSTKVVLR